jgi:hypothetical protein
MLSPSTGLRHSDLNETVNFTALLLKKFIELIGIWVIILWHIDLLLSGDSVNSSCCTPATYTQAIEEWYFLWFAPRPLLGNGLVHMFLWLHMNATIGEWCFLRDLC